MIKDTQIYKEKLLAEKSKLETELGTIGVQNPNNSSDWEGKETKLDTDEADEGEVAFAEQEMITNSALVGQLEIQLTNVNDALKKIELGTYGLCEMDNEPIEEERLVANPSAKTCMEHMV